MISKQLNQFQKIQIKKVYLSKTNKIKKNRRYNIQK